MYLYISTPSHSSAQRSTPTAYTPTSFQSKLSQIADLLVEKIITPIIKVLEQLLQLLKTTAASFIPLRQQPSATIPQELAPAFRPAQPQDTPPATHHPLIGTWQPPTPPQQPAQTPPPSNPPHSQPEQPIEIPRSPNGQPLTADQRFLLAQLKRGDRSIVMHEKQHQEGGGDLADEPQYNYQQGPDGKQYRISGSVRFTWPEGRTHEETLSIHQRIFQGALAPNLPSQQDYVIAGQALEKMIQVKNNMMADGKTEQAQKTQRQIEQLSETLKTKQARQQNENQLTTYERAAEAALEVAQTPSDPTPHYFGVAEFYIKEMSKIKENMIAEGKTAEVQQAQSRIDHLRQALLSAR